MFSAIAKLFGKSPFAPLQSHIDNVSLCIEKLPALFMAFSENDTKKVQQIALEISNLEHEADKTKNDIRNHLPKSLFLPIDRADFLIILSIQDSFADKAEDIGILTTLRFLENYQELKPEFDCFWEGNIKAFFLAKSIMQEFDSLIEASFGGVEAAKVKDIIDQIAEIEEDLDHQQYNLLKKIYQASESLPYSSFHLWLMLLKDIGSLSNSAESMGNKVRMILELKN
jgi:hypothetical protein